MGVDVRAVSEAREIEHDLEDELWRAWEPGLFNQTHDIASGVMTDHVYEDTLSSYRFSQRLAVLVSGKMIGTLFRKTP